MKKTIMLILTAVLVLCFAACEKQKNDNTNGDEAAKTTVVTTTAKVTTTSAASTVTTTTKKASSDKKSSNQTTKANVTNQTTAAKNVTTTAPATTKKNNQNKSIINIPKIDISKIKIKRVTEITPAEIDLRVHYALGSGYTCNGIMLENELKKLYKLDFTQIECYVAKKNILNGKSSDRIIILKVKDGYADRAVNILNEGFASQLSAAEKNGMEIQKVKGTRLYRSGNFVALITAGAAPSATLSEKDAQKLADSEYEKIDKVWKGLFTTVPENRLVVS